MHSHVDPGVGDNCGLKRKRKRDAFLLEFEERKRGTYSNNECMSRREGRIVFSGYVRYNVQQYLKRSRFVNSDT